MSSSKMKVFFLYDFVNHLDVNYLSCFINGTLLITRSAFQFEITLKLKKKRKYEAIKFSEQIIITN